MIKVKLSNYLKKNSLGKAKNHKKILLINIHMLILIAITKPSGDSFKQHINTELKCSTKHDFLTNVVKSVSKKQGKFITNYYDKFYLPYKELKLN